MARRIIWTKPAADELEQVIEYWNHRNKSTRYGKKIRKSLRQSLKLISIKPNIGRRTSLPLIKVKLVLTHFFLIYKLGDSNEIVILNFWDCRQDPTLNQYLK